VFEDDLLQLPNTLVNLKHLEELVIQTNHEQKILSQIKTYPIQAKKIVMNDMLKTSEVDSMAYMAILIKD